MSRMGWERPEDREEQQEFERNTSLRERLFFLRIIVVVVLGLLLGRVIYLQQIEGDSLEAAAQDRLLATLRTNAPRGVIFDRDGRPLAENLAQFNVSVTIADLPTEEDARQAIFERVSILTGVPVTNTVAQERLIELADPTAVGITNRLAGLYDAETGETLDLADVVDDLPTSIEDVVNTFNFDPFNPHVIASSVPITLARIIEQESVFLPGITVEADPIRNYPSGEYTAHLIGFMGPIPDLSYVDRGYARDDRVGLFGLESSMEERLAGEKGEREIEVDATGREVRQVGLPTEPIAGYNLQLTLDLELQQAAQNILLSFMDKRRQKPTTRVGAPSPDLEIEQGVVVALNPKNGEVLAMVNIPTFDNNRFATEIPVEYYLQLARNDYLPLFNNAIGGAHPPGSVFKIVTQAAALQEGIVSADRRLDAPGLIVIPNRFAPNDPGRAQQFVCWISNPISFDFEKGENVPNNTHGAVNAYEAMSQSCDIYYYKISGGFNQDGEQVDALGIDRLKSYANQFGLGVIQGIELPAESPGNIPSEEWKRQIYFQPWSTGDDYNTAIGQGYVTATPLQITNMAAVIANGGFLYRPTIVHHMTDENGRVVVFDENDVPYFAEPGEDRIPRLYDQSGNPVELSDVNFTVQFDEDGNYVRQPELINTVAVERQYLDVIAEGMRLVNQRGGTASGWDDLREQIINPDGTFATYIDSEGVERRDFTYWLDPFGIETAGKTGTAEFCDNIALAKGWCADGGQIQPSHSWYVGYAPFDDPEIVVAAFMYNAEEGSEWAAPVVRYVMEAYFGVGDFASLEE